MLIHNKEWTLVTLKSHILLHNPNPNGQDYTIENMYVRDSREPIKDTELARIHGCMTSALCDGWRKKLHNETLRVGDANGPECVFIDFSFAHVEELQQDVILAEILPLPMNT